MPAREQHQIVQLVLIQNLVVYSMLHTTYDMSQAHTHMGIAESRHFLPIIIHGNGPEKGSKGSAWPETLPPDDYYKGNGTHASG